MINAKDVNIIIPFHRNKKMLEMSLQTLEKSFENALPRITIIANNINPTEIELELDASKYVVHYYNKNLFWPGALNIGASISDSKFLLFCDPDIYYTPHWFESLCRCYDSHPNTGVVSAKLLNPLNNRIMDFGMGYNTYNTIHVTKDLMCSHPLTSQDRLVQAACGAIFLTTHADFEKVGGIDESMPYIYCDNDYSIKMKELGKDTWVAADSIVFHKGNTDKANSKYKNFSYLREDSKASFYAKNIQRRSIDIEHWFSIVWKWYLSNSNNKQNNYILFNFCTLPDSNMYVDCMKQTLKLHILSERQIVMAERDILQIALYDYIPTEMIASRVPFIYFVDSFLSLRNSSLWCSLRDVSNDLVIDRHCNILNMMDIVKHKV